MPLRTAVHTITVARGEPKEKIEIFNGTPIRRMLAPLIRIKPGFVVDLTQDELDYLNREAPESIRKPKQEEIDAYKAAGGKGDESKAATKTDAALQAEAAAAAAAEAAAAEAAAAAASTTTDSKKDGGKKDAASTDDSGL
jgi:hypothetical protein